MSSKPDFIIIGAMKCATSTLHGQLAMVPGIHMSTPKEPNFFSDDSQYKLGMEWYKNLFNDGENSISGESSTHYTKLPTYPLTLARIKKANLENTRFIYIIRDPVDRLISHYIHEWSQGKIKSEINSAIESFPELISYSSYFYQLSAFLKELNSPEILLVFFESLKTRPHDNFQEILKFISSPIKSAWNENLEAQNVSSQRIRKFPLYRLLIESKIFQFLRRTLIPQSLRNTVKKKLTLQYRPALSDKNLNTLRLKFDEDLGKLSELVNLELNSHNFKGKVKDQLPIKISTINV